MKRSGQKVITVFGGTGFIGRHAVYALARSGAEIRVATRSPASAYFLKPAGVPGQIVPIACNIHDDASVAAALSGATHAVNLVGILFQKGRKNSFQKIHVEAPARIARIAKEKNLEMLVHISALGASREGASKYARSKGEGENKVIHAFGQSVLLRPSVVFGPEDHFFNRFAGMAEAMHVLPLIGGGGTRFQPVYVGDIAEAIAAMLADPDMDRHFGQIYELGGPRTYTFKELLDFMLGVIQQHAHFISLPFPLAKFFGLFAGLLPNPALTVDQVRSLQIDNVIEQNSPGFKDLDIQPAALEAILPSYLWRYRPGGQFAKKIELS